LSASAELLVSFEITKIISDIRSKYRYVNDIKVYFLIFLSPIVALFIERMVTQVRRAMFLRGRVSHVRPILRGGARAS